MSRQKIKDYLKELDGRNLDDLNLACEMMMFCFGDISIHSQCFTRIIRNEQILLTTSDYQNWDGENEKHNDMWYNLARHIDLIINKKVIETQLTDTNDLLIWLENDVCIQMFISHSCPHYGDDREQWRIFRQGNVDVPHTVVYSQTVQDE